MSFANSPTVKRVSRGSTIASGAITPVTLPSAVNTAFSVESFNGSDNAGGAGVLLVSPTQLDIYAPVGVRVFWTITEYWPQ